MPLSPIVLFAYNRADHLSQTIHALAKCPEAISSQIFFFSDGPKKESDIPKVRSVRDTMHEIQQANLFQSINIVESPVNKGLAASVIVGVSEVMEKFGKAIILEDDCVPSPYFLHFMNKALDAYESKAQIGAIAGYTPPITFPTEYNQDAFLAYRSCSWGWAAWKRSWLDVDWELKSFADFLRNPALIARLNANGSDRFIRLYRQCKGNGSSWSVRFGAHLVRNNLLTVYPRFSYIQNIGCDASGIHSKAEDAISMKVDLNKAIPDPVIGELHLNPQLQAILKRHYSSGWLSDMKHALFAQWIRWKYAAK